MGVYTKIRMKFKKIVAATMPSSVVDLLYYIYDRIAFDNMQEERTTFGSLNVDKTFYVIRPRPNSVEGLMSLLLYVLQHISYAEEKGYIPVVDFQKYDTQYRDDTRLGENVWEFFFKQISSYTLDEVYKSKNVILSGVPACRKGAKCLVNRSFEENDIKEVRRYIEKYIDYSEVSLSLLRKEEGIINPKKTLGLYLRGTDYIKMKPVGEAVQPSLKQVFEIADQWIEKYEIEQIYLVTEDAEIYNEVKSYYGRMICTVSYDKYIQDYKGAEFLANDTVLNQLDESPRCRGLQYLVKILLLAKCNYIVGGKTCGSWAACCFASEHVKKYIFDLGIY